MLFNKKRNRNAAVIALSSALLMTTFPACTKHKGLPDGYKTQVISIDTASLAAQSFQKDIQPILERRCTTVNGRGCHVSESSEGAPGDFTSYDGIQQKCSDSRHSFYYRVLVKNDNPMPPTSVPALTNLELNQLLKWYGNGFPNN